MKLFKYLLAVAAIASMASCSDDIVSPEETTEVPDRLTITLNIPDYIRQEVGTRAEGDVVYCICQNSAGGYLDKTSAVIQAGNKVTIPLHKQTAKIQLVTDYNVEAGKTDLTGVTLSLENELVMWGEANLRDLLTDPTVTMLRSIARVAVRTTDTNFKDVSFAVYGAPDSGTLAPNPANMDSKEGNLVNKPTLPQNVQYNRNFTNLSSASKCLFEATPTDFNDKMVPRTRLIVKGTYKGKESYYVMALAQQDTLKRQPKDPKEGPWWGHETPEAYDYKPLPVLRNHYYDVVIDEVHSEGWSTLAEALNAPADNRITYTITDTNESVNSIIANADYMLGVQDAVTVTADATVANVTVVASYIGEPNLVFSVDNENDRTWITAPDISSLKLVSSKDDAKGYGKNTYVYNVPVILKPNMEQTERTGTVTVKHGQLTRTFTITQAHRDYMRDPDRKVTLKMTLNGSTSQLTDNYFTWISETVAGTGPEAFHQGIRRDDGLNFPAVNAYSVEYQIPVLNGDKSCSIVENSGVFSVSKSGDNKYYIVKSTGTATSVSTGKLAITNSNGIIIEYPLYRTGYLHQLTTAQASQFMRPGGAVTGWFYYEVVNINGKWTLDRNLGASSNFSYITTSASTLSHSDAVGAYFKVSESKSASVGSPVTIIPSLGVGNFDLPTRDELAAMNIQALNIGSGEAIVVATAKSSTNVNVYFPHGGYYEDIEHRYETHANLWTKTLVAGNQGFSEGSPDFGYWYQYFDCYTSKVGFSNMRYFDGATGEAPTAESVYKYMPIRLVWR